MLKLKLKVVREHESRPRVKRWRSDAERLRLPRADVGEGLVPPLPKPTHDALERLLGKKVEGGR